MPTLFDAYIAVDWSARGKPSPRKPSKDSVWVGETASPARAGGRPAERYFRTRQACTAYLYERLAHHVEAGHRVFLGLAGSAPWRQVWAELTRLIVDQDNLNNRFKVAARLNVCCGGASPGPLWGCPPPKGRAPLRATSPVYPYPVGCGRTLSRLRLTDARQRGVQPVWKLYGNGSVGSQVLVGVPVVATLRDDPCLSAFSRVWPSETGFTPAPTPDRGPFVLHAEI